MEQESWNPTGTWNGYVAHSACLIQQVQDAQSAFYEIDARLVVVEIDEGPFYGFLDVLLLLQLEHMLLCECVRVEVSESV